MERVTLLSRQHAMLAHVRGATSRLAHAQAVAATGLQVTVPSDDPSVAGLLVRLRASLSERQALQERLALADLQFAATDASLDDAARVMQRAQEVAVAMANGTMTAEDLQAAAEEVESLLAEMVDVANSDYGGRYLFAGPAWDAPPFADDGAYTGSSSEVSLSLGEGRSVVTGVPGDAVFSGASGGADVLGTLSALVAALQAGDGAGVSDLLDDVQDAYDHLVAARVESGSRHGFVQDAAVRAEEGAYRLDTDITALTDADLTAAYAELADAQTAWEAVLQVSSQALGLNVFDYLG